MFLALSVNERRPLTLNEQGFCEALALSARRQYPLSR